MPDVSLTDGTISLLKALARPLEDTYDSLIARLGRDALAPRRNSSTIMQGLDGTTTNGTRADPVILKHVSKMSPSVRNMYDKLTEIIYTFDGAHPHGVKTYIGFRVGTRNFAAVFPQKAGLAIWIRPEVAGLALGAGGEHLGVAVHRADNTYWPLDTRFNVTPGMDLTGVTKLLRASYDSVTGTAATGGQLSE